MNVTAYAASVGHSVWFSHDLGETWNRAFTPTGGIYNESRAWCVATHPARPGDVLAGTDLGVYRWTVAADRWEHLPSPMDDLHILQIARSPHDPDIVFAGTRPAQVYRSADGGRTWRRCDMGNGVECEFINTPRVTSIHFDPRDPGTIWVTVEIDGIFVSRDGGETWEKCNEGLKSPDTHNLVFFDDDSGPSGSGGPHDPVLDRGGPAPQPRRGPELAVDRGAGCALALFPLHRQARRRFGRHVPLGRRQAFRRKRDAVPQPRQGRDLEGRRPAGAAQYHHLVDRDQCRRS